MFEEKVILENDTLKLKPINEQGLADFIEYSTNIEFYKYLEYQVFDKKDCVSYFLRMIEFMEKNERFYWFITKKNDGKVIGTFGLRNFDFKKKSVEISYGISPKFWNKGYFKTSLKLVLDFLFLEKKFHRVISTTHIEHESSIRGLKKLGFTHESLLREYIFMNNHWEDFVVYSILDHEYKK